LEALEVLEEATPQATEETEVMAVTTAHQVEVVALVETALQVVLAETVRVAFV
jgi:molybdopterin synthase catalytic subunit